jgi:hypothetical protein
VAEALEVSDLPFHEIADLFLFFLFGSLWSR